jgi:tRNA(fMet)-specific endonuclease VapC
VIHLDTTFLVDLLREARRKAGAATSFLETIEEQELSVSIHVLCELHAGAELSSDPVQERQAIDRICGDLQICYPDDRFPQLYGHLLATPQRSGRAISVMDLLIATSALLDGAPLVTRNLDHFTRVPGLEVLRY